MRAGTEGVTVPGRAAAVSVAALVGCALFFSGGSAQGPLVALGTAALLLAAALAAAVALRALPAARLPAPALALLLCLAALVVWTALSIAWSSEPSTSWRFSNRALVYLAFACVGVLLGGVVRRAPVLAAGTLAALLGAVIAWALAAKTIPPLERDYERLARLRDPVGYWNELAVLCDAAIALGLWLASSPSRSARARAAGVVLVYAAGVAVLLTYSRFGIALAALVAVLWVVLERDRVESLAALTVAALPAIGVFGLALALPGITDDGVTRAQRAHDAWIFAPVLVVVCALVFAAALALTGARVPPELRIRVERGARWVGVAGAIAVVVLAVVFSGRIWDTFTNASAIKLGQGSGRLASASSSNRWTWWQEAWGAFTRHPVGGTGGGTFGLTNRLERPSSFDVATEPHNVPLQFLSETGIVGLALWLGAVAAAAVGIARARGDGAVTALGLGVLAWTLHMVVDIDWSYVAVCGPLLLVTGLLLAGEGSAPVPRRRLLAVAGGIALALGAVYAVAAPWLADRELARSQELFASNLPAALDAAETAHRYDPLSTDVLTWWAALEDARRRPAQARELYRDAVRTEPLNPDTWYELGAFEYDQRNWVAAYKALDRSWGLDRHGPAGERCGLLDRVRKRVLGYGPSCPTRRSR